MSVRTHHLKKIRALAVVKERAIDGLTMAEIATRHNISTKTVRRILTWAEKAEIYVELEDELLRTLAPAAMDAVKHALVEEKDASVALEVLKGLNLLKKTHVVTTKEAQDANDLVSYITQVREKAEIQAATVPGELIEAPPEPLALPPGPIRLIDTPEHE